MQICPGRCYQVPFGAVDPSNPVISEILSFSLPDLIQCGWEQATLTRYLYVANWSLNAATQDTTLLVYSSSIVQLSLLPSRAIERMKARSFFPCRNSRTFASILQVPSTLSGRSEVPFGGPVRAYLSFVSVQLHRQPPSALIFCFNSPGGPSLAHHRFISPPQRSVCVRQDVFPAHL